MSRIKTKFITENAVTNAKLAQMAQSTIKGRAAASGTGDPVDLTATQATAILDNFTGDSGSGGVKGLVPAPAAGDAAASKFLKADGTWATTGGGSAITSLTTDVVATGPGAAVATIQANVVTDSKLRQSAGLSVIGRSTNTTGDVADVTAASDAQILRRSGTSIGFGSIDLSQSAAVGSSILPLANGGTNKAMTAVSGAIAYSDADSLELTAAGSSGQVLTSAGTGTPTWQFGAVSQIFGSRGTPRSVVAATGITSGASHMSTTALQQDIYVEGSVSGDSVAATITAGTIDGQRMTIIGRNNSNTVSLTTSTTNVFLNGNITLGANSIVTLRWDTNEWVEVSRNG